MPSHKSSSDEYSEDDLVPLSGCSRKKQKSGHSQNRQSNILVNPPLNEADNQIISHTVFGTFRGLCQEVNDIIGKHFFFVPL